MRRVSWASTRSWSRSRRFSTAARMAGSVISWNTIRRTGHLGLERVEQVPGDGLALAVGVGGEQQLVDRLQRVLELGDLALLLRRDDVERLRSRCRRRRRGAPTTRPCTWPGRRRHRGGGRGCGRRRTRRCSRCRGTSGSWWPWCRTRRSPGVAVGRPPSWPRACGVVRPRQLPRRSSSSSFRLSRAVQLHRLRSHSRVCGSGPVRTLGVAMVTVRARIPVCRESVTTSVKALGSARRAAAVSRPRACGHPVGCGPHQFYQACHPSGAADAERHRRPEPGATRRGWRPRRAPGGSAGRAGRAPAGSPHGRPARPP